jgi:large subunit ribosomal protein L18Ae
MYREYRDVSLNAAITTLYDDMAGRHRSRAQAIQIIRTAVVPSNKVKRDSTLQLITPNLKFPLPHRILRAPSKKVKSVFSSFSANTHFN